MAGGTAASPDSIFLESYNRSSPFSFAFYMLYWVWGDDRMKKVVCIILITLICISGIVFGIKHFNQRSNIKKLLNGVGIENDFKSKQLDYDYWKDPLWYVNGYEVIALRIDPEKWITPEGWYRKQISIEEIEPIVEFEIRESAITDLKADFPDRFDECYFAETGREGEFKNWQFHVGLYSHEGLLIVYRGHDLNSETWRLLDDEDVPWMD